MGGVDRGDQLRGYYATKLKCRKFKYIVNFLLGVSLTNSYILHHVSDPSSKMSLKTFQEMVSKQLIGSYCSKKKPRRVSHSVRQLSLLHFSKKKKFNFQQEKRSMCFLSGQKQSKRHQWFCHECGVWLCHQRTASDCFLHWHKDISM